MNINKKLGRVKQWAGEKMGQESKTGVSDEFKALEMEMTLRYEGTSAGKHSGAVLIFARDGEAAQVYDYICQVPLEAQRSGRQGENPAGWTSGPGHDTPWGGL